MEITGTVPDLLGGARRLAGPARRLSDTTLTVEFEVVATEGSDVQSSDVDE